MDTPDKTETKNGDEDQFPFDRSLLNSIHRQLDLYQKENQVLLNLSNLIAKVRNKYDLVEDLSSLLKGIFPSTHDVILLIKGKNNGHSPHLPEGLEHPNKGSGKFNKVIQKQFSPRDPFSRRLLDLKASTFFQLDEIMYEQGAPEFLKLNHKAGVRNLLVCPLRNRLELSGFICITSGDSKTSLARFHSMLQAMAPHLSGAVSNIIANEEIQHKERVNHVLLSLSNEMATVRDAESLLYVINSGLKKLIYFTRCVMTVLNETGEFYHVFSIDSDSRAKEATKAVYPVKDGIYLNATLSGKPMVIDMSSVDLDKAPLWFKLNYADGAREMAIKVLTVCRPPKQSLILFSNEVNTLDDKALETIERISNQLATTVNNISSNQEILEKDKDKTFLLEFSHSVAAARTRGDLNLAIHAALKKLSEVRAYFIRTINKDGMTMSPFMHDKDIFYIDSPGFKNLLNTKIPVNIGITARVLSSNAPVLIDFEEEIRLGNTDNYIAFWKTLGSQKPAFQKMFGMSLRLGTTDLGVLWVITPKINRALLEGICAQISLAIANIRSNEEIAERDTEKSILLSLTSEITALRNRNDLLNTVNKQFKTLFSIESFGFLQTNGDGTYSTFLLDLKKDITSQPEFTVQSTAKFRVTDPIFTRLKSSTEPILFDVNKLAEEPGMPGYVRFWKKLGLQQVLAMALRVGGKNIGCAFFHIDTNTKIKNNLLKAVVSQIAVAISNIRSNEEIAEREAEKSILLSISDEIASLRSRNDLLQIVNTRIKALFSVTEFGIAQINDDDSTYSSFVLDLQDRIKSDTEFSKITSRNYEVGDRVFSRIMNSKGPFLLDVLELAKDPNIPDYIHLWKRAGLHHVLAAALRAGGRNIGCAFLHVSDGNIEKIKINLLKSVCSQLSVAVSNILANEQLLSYKQMLEVENDYLKEQIQNIYNFSDIVGSGREMQKVYRLMSLVSETNSTVLLLGETGTGKELIARAIHNASPRKAKLMIKVNCAALPPNLIESELFGHEKGSFTGAVERRIGKFELADNSTLLLDEIGEMPVEIQVKLLRVIQEREFERVGGKVPIKVDVRLIAATNRDLEQDVNAGRFRSDLYYRLNVFPIVLPPLRSRMEDIPSLVNFFLARYNKNCGKNVTSLSKSVMQELKSYQWPGNVRELEHLIERSILLTEGNVLHKIQLPAKASRDNASLSEKTLDQFERSYIIEVLKRCGGKISGKGGAAESLKIPSTTLHSKMKKLAISKEDYFSKPT